MNNTNKPWSIDVAVLCIFFARPEIFEKCFARVREVRPRTLLLWQDGPRKGRKDDMDNIEKCRKIAENIDWNCQVYRKYHAENMGCDPSTHLSHKWAFSIVDKCIILEDDIVPSVSFFPFCKELLDKYENDNRIDRICGMNILGCYDTGSDYFFSRFGNSWGWASWRRVAETWDTNYEFLENAYCVKLLESCTHDKYKQKQWLDRCRKHKKVGVPYWEFIVGARSLLYSGLIIYPSKNMISNVGLDVNSTHAPADVKMLPSRRKRLFYMKTHEYDFPLKAPVCMMADDIFVAECMDAVRVRVLEKFYSRMVRLWGMISKLGVSN